MSEAKTEPSPTEGPADADVVALLARLDADEAERLFRASVARRKREAEEHRRAALRIVRLEVYGDIGKKAAAAELAAAVRGDRLPLVDSEEGRRRARCRPTARNRLEELAGLDRFQIKASRVKQLLKVEK